MSTELHLEPTNGKLVTAVAGTNPVRNVRVVSKTTDSKFSSPFIDLQYSYGQLNTRELSISFEDIDMVVDALLEHQAARRGRLENIAEGEARREKYRRQFLERRRKRD